MTAAAAPMPARVAQGRSGPLAYSDTGSPDGIPLVFVHGVNMASGVWTPMVERLRHESRCITFDLRGHGSSTRCGPFRLDDYLSDLEAVLATAGVERAVLVGVSLGGMVACLFAQQSPERTAAVIAFGSALRGVHENLDAGMARLRELGVAGYFSASLPRNSLAEGAADGVRRATVALAVTGRDDVRMVEEITRSAFSTDMTDRARSSGRPVLVVTGAADATCPPDAGREFAAAVGGVCHVVVDAGHVLPLEQPQECVSLVQEFIRVIG